MLSMYNIELQRIEFNFLKLRKKNYKNVKES